MTVFEREGLAHIHIEPFRPENLANWVPETETDVYLAFGVLQEYTDFKYCCGASTPILKKLGVKFTAIAKPDALMIDRITDQYVIGEMKKSSSDYKTNHHPWEVDVLVCWTDNEPDKTKLPPRVVSLKSVAKHLALINLELADRKQPDRKQIQPYRDTSVRRTSGTG